QAEMIESIKRKVDISVGKHGSNVVAIVGHHDCAGNPVSCGYHWDQIKKAVDVMGAWNLGVTLLGLWVNEEWEIEVVSE
ncbi:MAG: carbonic anhydrase, partial [Gemmatimonadota bacterium]|nr:carbonic anhydrase [Gemmatimonadota bacterium]